MKKVNENDFEYRHGDSGPKYLMRGPNIDWGVMVLKPGTKMGAHGHKETEETFYFLKGSGLIRVDDIPHTVMPGDVYYVNPEEKHDIENTGKTDMKVIFIKYPYLPDDKIKYN